MDNRSKPCYDFKGISPAMGYLQDLTNYCNQLGWGVYQTDHEDANGQYEVNFMYTDALTTADRFTFFKMMTSQVATKYGAIATHMPKPFSNRTGSGAHIHFHLAKADGGENVFTDLADKRGLGLSKTAYHFLGGILKHATALCAITSPTVNATSDCCSVPAFTAPVPVSPGRPLLSATATITGRRCCGCADRAMSRTVPFQPAAIRTWSSRPTSWRVSTASRTRSSRRAEPGQSL